MWVLGCSGCSILKNMMRDRQKYVLQLWYTFALVLRQGVQNLHNQQGTTLFVYGTSDKPVIFFRHSYMVMYILYFVNVYLVYCILYLYIVDCTLCIHNYIYNYIYIALSYMLNVGLFLNSKTMGTTPCLTVHAVHAGMLSCRIAPWASSEASARSSA
jgi:hypothetical protein